MRNSEFPGAFPAGDTFSVERTYADYPASEGWTVRFVIVNADNRYEVQGFAFDGKHLVDADSIETASWAAGDYKWKVYAEDGSSPSVRHTVESGSINILPDLDAGPIDDRSHVKKTLDLIEREIEIRTSGSVESYSISGRQLAKTPMSDLLEMRSRYRAWYEQELQAERVARGLGTKRKVLTRFT
jgi:hypothetical protein